MLTIFLAACAPIEEIPSQVGDVFEGLADCAALLTEAEAHACGERVLDGFRMEWECSCIGGETWTTCATRDEAFEEVVWFPDGKGGSCHCNRVGLCE